MGSIEKKKDAGVCDEESKKPAIKSEDNNPQNKAKPDESKSLVNDDKIKKESESMIVASNSDDDQPEKKNGDAAINTSDKPEAEKDISHTDATNEKNDTTPAPGSIES